jgi:hypothetical protein
MADLFGLPLYHRVGPTCKQLARLSVAETAPAPEAHLGTRRKA